MRPTTKLPGLLGRDRTPAPAPIVAACTPYSRRRRTGLPRVRHGSRANLVRHNAHRMHDRRGRLRAAPRNGRPGRGRTVEWRDARPRQCRSSAARRSPTPTGSAASPAGSPGAGEGVDLVVVVSAMGDTTDELLALAGAITDDPDPRELDVLLATGEHQSATLVSMALHALGVPAISLTGAQAGIPTDGRYGRARIANVDPRRVRAGARAGQGRDRGRLPGHGRPTTRPAPSRADPPASPRRRDDDPRPRRLRHDRRRPGRPAGRRPLPDLHRRPRHLHRRPAPRRPTPASCRHRLRGDARAGPPGRPGDADPRRRARLGQRRRHRGPELVRGRARHAHQGGPARGAAQQGPRPGPRPERRQGHAGRRAGPAGRRPDASSSRWRRPASTST